MLRGDDLDLAGLDLGLRDDALHAAPVVDVAVGINDGHDRFAADVLVDQVHPGFGCGGAQQRVYHHVAAIRFDDAHYRQVEAANLVDAVGDLEQPVVECIQPRYAPQAGVDRGWGDLFLQKGVRPQVPDRTAVVGGDDRIVEAGDEAPRGQLEIQLVFPLEFVEQEIVRCCRIGCRVFLIRHVFLDC